MLLCFGALVTWSSKFSSVSLAPTMSTAYIGTVVHSIALDELEIMPRAAIVVDADGIITAVHKDSAILEGSGSVKVVDFGQRVIFPGLIDTHAHAPQYAQLGLGTDLPLLDWLNKYTFVTEAKMKDVGHARRVYSDVVRRCLGLGTTSIYWFASHHLPATKALADVCLEQGQHAFIGKVNMDCNCPDFYVEENAQASLHDTRELVDYVLSLKSPLIVPIITPRFAVSCTNELMKGLGELAKERNLPIQSHVSENKAEIAFVAEKHPESSSYVDVYRLNGLLNERTVLAHGVHLTDAEIDAMLVAKSSLSHCPISNFTLCSGSAPVREYLNKGLTVGLGTDLSGGPSASMWQTMRETIVCSTAVSYTRPELKPFSFQEACYLGTVGGAKVLGMENLLGSFAPGKWFNAQVLNAAAPAGPIDTYDNTPEEIFQKIFYLCDDRTIENVYVKGKRVK